jgi:hypothetical protein
MGRLTSSQVMMLLARRYSVQRHSLPLLEFLEVQCITTAARRHSSYLLSELLAIASAIDYHTGLRLSSLRLPGCCQHCSQQLLAVYDKL